MQNFVSRSVSIVALSTELLATTALAQGPGQRVISRSMMRPRAMASSAFTPMTGRAGLTIGSPVRSCRASQVRPVFQLIQVNVTKSLPQAGLARMIPRS